MVKPEWGTKRACLSCGAKFYDLTKDPIICPKCETKFEPVVAKPRRTRAAPPPKPAPVKVAEPEAEDDDALIEDDDDDIDDAVIEDTSDLDGDDEDVPVKVVGDEPES